MKNNNEDYNVEDGSIIYSNNGKITTFEEFLEAEWEILAKNFRQVNQKSFIEFVDECIVLTQEKSKETKVFQDIESIKKFIIILTTIVSKIKDNKSLVEDTSAIAELREYIFKNQLFIQKFLCFSLNEKNGPGKSLINFLEEIDISLENLSVRELWSMLEKQIEVNQKQKIKLDDNEKKFKEEKTNKQYILEEANKEFSINARKYKEKYHKEVLKNKSKKTEYKKDLTSKDLEIKSIQNELKTVQNNLKVEEQKLNFTENKLNDRTKLLEFSNKKAAKFKTKCIKNESLNTKLRALLEAEENDEIIVKIKERKNELEKLKAGDSKRREEFKELRAKVLKQIARLKNKGSENEKLANDDHKQNVAKKNTANKVIKFKSNFKKQEELTEVKTENKVLKNKNAELQKTHNELVSKFKKIEEIEPGSIKKLLDRKIETSVKKEMIKALEIKSEDLINSDDKIVDNNKGSSDTSTKSKTIETKVEPIVKNLETSNSESNKTSSSKITKLPPKAYYAGMTMYIGEKGELKFEKNIRKINKEGGSDNARVSSNNTEGSIILDDNQGSSDTSTKSKTTKTKVEPIAKNLKTSNSESNKTISSKITKLAQLPPKDFSSYLEGVFGKKVEHNKEITIIGNSGNYSSEDNDEN